MSKGKPFYREYGELLQKTIISADESYIDYSKPLNNLVMQNLPKQLFRFRTCNENSIDAFRRNRIYFNTPNNFNDPHDCLVYINSDKIKQDIDSGDIDSFIQLLKIMIDTKEIPPVLKNIFSENIYGEVLIMLENSPDVLKQRLEDITTNINELITYAKNESHDTCSILLSHIKQYSKLACFSQSIKETLMWSYYADSHKGFALEYDFSDYTSQCDECANKCNDQVLAHDLYPVVYTDKRYDATDLALYFIKDKISQKFNMDIFVNNGIPDRLAFQKANTYKANCWRHEKEWRMELHCNRNSNRFWCDCKPKAIYFGCYISDINRDILIRYAKENKVDAFQMDIQMSKLEYKLNFTRLKS